MSFEDHPAADNIRYLRQGIELLQKLDDGLFAGEVREESQRTGVGKQIRHCIDFYECFLRGPTDERVDYNARSRELELELERNRSIQRLEELIERLAGLDPERMDATLHVRIDGDGESGWCRSSARRELQFLLSHTIHHYALIALMLESAGFRLGDRFAEFGVAPSTIRHWKQTGR